MQKPLNKSLHAVRQDHLWEDGVRLKKGIARII